MKRAALLGLIVIGVLAAVPACKRDSSATLPPPPAELVPDAAVAADSAAANSGLWRAAIAASDDPIELARLAEVEGAAGLLAGLEEGGGVGVVALLALPYADDAEIAMQRLAEIVVQVDAQAMGAVIDAMEGIVQQPRRQIEPLAPMGLHTAFDALLSLAKRTDLPAPVRARAISVARLIAARGPYDAKLLPTDLDR